MTFVFGSRCTNGVVLVADRKVTLLDDGLHFDFCDKLFGFVEHVIVGSSGSTDTFELFRGHLMHRVRTNRVHIEDVNIVIGEIVFDLNTKYNFKKELVFEVLVAVQYMDKKSALTYINAYGVPRTIEGCTVIGTGGKYVKALLEKGWRDTMTMDAAAELGWLMIKYIEDLRLDFSVGLGGRAPQIFYIPDFYTKKEIHGSGPRRDKELTNENELRTIETRALKMFKKHERQLKNLFA